MSKNGHYNYILTFHGLGKPSRELEPGEEGLWLQKPDFEAILDWVKRYPNVSLTFDDGNTSDIEIALPCLRERGLQAEFFVSVARLGTPGFLKPEELVTMEKAGMKIGLHGMNHRSWKGLDEKELKIEIEDAKRALESMLGHTVENVACPLGYYNRRVIRILKRVDFKIIYTSDHGIAISNYFLRPRISIRKYMDVNQIEDLFSHYSSLSGRMSLGLRTFIKQWR